MNEGLNSPIAIVAILTVILTSGSVFIREVFWIFKNSKKNSGPNGHLDRTLDKMTSTLQNMNTNLTLLNNRAERTERVTERTHEAVLKLYQGGK